MSELTDAERERLDNASISLSYAEAIYILGLCGGALVSLKKERPEYVVEDLNVISEMVDSKLRLLASELFGVRVNNE